MTLALADKRVSQQEPHSLQQLDAVAPRVLRVEPPDTGQRLIPDHLLPGISQTLGERVDRYQVAAEFAHQFAFDRHRELVVLGAADEDTRRLLAESATIALQEIPAFVRDWHPVEREWFEVELLDPAELPRMTEVLKARFAELSPVLRRFVPVRTRSWPSWSSCSTRPGET